MEFRSTMLALTWLSSAVQTASALDLLYNFEGDSGTAVTDKLTGDGAQDGVTINNVNPADTSIVPWGTQSAFFDAPLNPDAAPPFSHISTTDTIFGDDYSVTLAAFADLEPGLDRFVRIFSSFNGNGSATNRLLLDLHPNGTSFFLRGFATGAAGGAATATSAPPGFGTPGYHHYALTLDGATQTLSLFFDGSQVASTVVPAGYSNVANLTIGEDAHVPPTNTANEQFVGNMDEILVLSRALSAAEIGQLAGGTSVSSVVTPAPGERAIYYDFEGDSGSTATDKFTLDGSQDGLFVKKTTINAQASDARLGSQSVNFQHPLANEPLAYSQINAGPAGVLGSTFTLSAVINPAGAGQFSGAFTRIMSTFAGAGPTAGTLIFDYNPVATGSGFGIRILLPNGESVTTVAAVRPTFGVNQTVTATYDNGNVKIYLDGVEVAAGIVNPSFNDLGTRDLRIGEDTDLVGIPNENFVGNMDDVLVLSRALTPAEVLSLHTTGADALLPTLPSPSTSLAGDYDADDDVDGADFLIWQRSLSMTGTSPADGNQDGVVDGFDLSVWRLHFGETITSATSVSLQVPEPGGAVLVLMGLTALATTFRKKQRYSGNLQCNSDENPLSRRA